MAWEPQADGLNQIITLLKQSQSTDNEIQRNVQMVRKKMPTIKKIKKNKHELSILINCTLYLMFLL